MLKFLMRLRIFHALTHSPVIRIEYFRQFWATAHLDSVPNPSVIRARVNGTDIAFFCDDLRQILQRRRMDPLNFRMIFGLVDFSEWVI